jgi:hypothetical protein
VRKNIFRTKIIAMELNMRLLLIILLNRMLRKVLKKLKKGRILKIKIQLKIVERKAKNVSVRFRRD